MKSKKKINQKKLKKTNSNTKNKDQIGSKRQIK
jgi:hypothetical protein